MSRVHCLPAKSTPSRPLPSNPPNQTARMPAGRGWSTWSRSLRSRSMSAGESRSTPPRPRSLGGQAAAGPVRAFRMPCATAGAGELQGGPRPAAPRVTMPAPRQEHHPALPGAHGDRWTHAPQAPSGRSRTSRAHGPARRREAPELATVPGQPRALRRPGRTGARASELTQRRHRALCASPHGGGTASTRAGSRGGLPSAGLLGVRRCARRTSNCANRGRLRGGEQDRDGAGRGPGCHRQTGGWPQCGPSTCARALRLHVLKVRIQLRQVKRTNSLL